MAPHFFNTLSGRVEEFQPLHDNEVRMYACGPTVYDYGHIGNFRTFVFVDLLRRYLKQHYKLRHVMNITDVDDKIIRNAAAAGVSINEYTRKYTQAFLEDSDSLNIEHPEIVRATDNIKEMARFIQQLAEKGLAYRTDDGSYYFRIAKFPEYGKLSKKDFAGMEDGARVDVDEYEKDNARDFALWKSPKPGEHFWETSIGPGRPGWHIECSVMSMKNLGETLDIHLGGEDLVFPHHENEIAQSEGLTGKPFSRFWIHARFLLVEGEKMSKSLGNFYTIRDLVLKGHKPSSIRYLLSSVPYRKQLNFTFDGLTQAANAVERLRNFKRRLEQEHRPAGSNEAMKKLAEGTIAKIDSSLADDMNTAQALGALFDMVRDANAAADKGELKQDDIAALLKALATFDAVFAVMTDDDAAKVKKTVEWAEAEGLTDKISPQARALAGAAGTSDTQIDALVKEMQDARKTKNFARGDQIRNELNQMGIIVEVTKEGARWRRK
jgi:cysteinyl-tRNA synthetase